MEAVKTKTKTAKTKTKTKTVKTKKEKTKTKTKTEKTKCKFLKKFIIVDGTSSSGKTKICKFFTGMNYKCIMTDEYQPIALVQFYKDLPNNYIDNESKEELFTEHLCNAMVKDAIAAKKALIDDISQSGLLKAFDKAGKSDDVFVIVVYAGLKDLARNVNSRRLEGDYRGIFVFTQFAERYIKCIDGDEKKIDTVKKSDFIAILKSHFKFEFASEAELITFADETFAKMDINDDETHSIKLRDEFSCGYLLNANEKTPQVIYDELKMYF